MKATSTSYKKNLIQDLADPVESAAYLNAALEEGTVSLFLLALRDVAEARGMAQLSHQTKLNRENMYRMLSRRGNPQLSSLASLLQSVGLRLSVEIKGPSKTGVNYAHINNYGAKHSTSRLAVCESPARYSAKPKRRRTATKQVK